MIGESARGEGRAFRFSPRPNGARNIHWREWGESAFEEAEDEGKLVFLSISAVWCHWCHVMDETTFSDPRVIERLNNHFVPVRVDSDMRPDINRRYNQGGWPTVAFLLPTGRHLTGVTYMPAAQLLQLIDRILAIYEHKKDSVEAELASDSLAEYRLLRSFANGNHSGTGVVKETEAAIIGMWDRVHGGLGTEPKFPHPEALEFALDRYVESQNRELGELVGSALDAMKDRDLADNEEGGFFRYATSGDWGSPHYEKMLADNAELISIYLKAAVALGNDDYKDTARRALEYVFSNLYDEKAPGFRGSQDADEEYYLVNAKKRTGLSCPVVDPTIYVDSSSSMISALVDSAAVLEKPELITVAYGVVNQIWDKGFKDSIGLCHYFNAPDYLPHVWGQPSDQIKFLKALIDLYELTLDRKLLGKANRLGDILAFKYMSRYGWLAEAGGMNGIGFNNGRKVLGDIPVDLPDMPINGLAVLDFTKLDIINFSSVYKETVGRIIGSLSAKTRAYGFFAANLASAIDFIDSSPLVVNVDIDAGKEDLESALKGIAAMMQPRVVVTAGSQDLKPSEAVKGRPIAVCCSGESCIPVGEVGKLRGEITAALQTH